jgi:hypothetical protein
MIRTGNRHWWASIGLLLCMLSVSTTAWAQATRNGSIAGTISDDSGGALPGVTVTVTSPVLQVPQLTRVSGGDGTYQFLDLPSGTYRVSYELPGFTTLVREGIILTTAFNARLDVTLPVATLAETVTVTGESPLIDVTSTSGGTTVTQVLLTSTPTNLNPQGVLALVGGVFVGKNIPLVSAVGGTNLGGGPVTYGQQTRMGLWMEGIKAIQSENPDYNSTDEVDVKSFGNSAEIDLPGASINVVFKSGGNDFHGRVSAEGQTDKMQSDNIDDKLRAQNITTANAPKYIRRVGADLGGRIIRNKLWFFAARNWEDSLRGVTGFADNPGPDGVYLTADDVAGFPWTRGINHTVKVSYQPHERHKFIGFMDHQQIDDEDKTASRLQPHEASRFSTTWNRQSKFEWQGVLNTSLLASATFGETGYKIIYRPHTDAGYGDRDPLPRTTCRFYRDTGLYTGNGCGGYIATPASGSSGAPWLDRAPHKLQYSGTITYVPTGGALASHDLRAGYLYTPGELSVQIPANEWNGVLLVYDRVAGGTYQPAEMWGADVPVDGVSNQNIFGTYLTDEWKVSPRFTINAGVRWERTTAYVPPQVKPQGQFGFSGTFPEVKIGTWSGFVPRVAGAFDVTGDGRTVVKATYGIFNHSEFNNFGNPITFTSPFQKNSPTQYRYRWSDPNRNNEYDPGEVNLDVNGPSFISVSGPANNIVNPDLKWGQTHEASASFEREVVSNVSVRALYVYKRIVQETGSQTFINVRRPYEVWNRALTRRDPGPDGALNTADDAGTVTVWDYDPAYRGANFVASMLPNVPADRSDSFNNLEIRLTKRPGTGKWYANTSFLATKNHRWIEAIAETPNSNYFPLDETWDYSGMFAGGYELPKGVNVSTFYQMFSGQNGQRTTIYRTADPDGGPALPSSSTITLRSGEYGDVSTPTRHQTNLRVAKRFQMGARRLSFNMDVFNIFNANTPYTQQTQSGPTFGHALVIAQPRVFRFSTRYEF